MLQTTFYNFNKKPNSTKIPSGGVTRNVTLLDNVSIITPRFLITGNIRDFTYNYMYWNGRYYWIEDKISITLQNIQINCRVDSMSSHKTEIGASEQYVLRAASEYDGRVSDTMYPTKVGKTRVNTSLYANLTSSNGFYMVGMIVGKNVSQRGTVCYYPMTLSDLEQTINGLAGWTAVNGKSPFDYITSCTYIPLDASTYLTTGTTISVSLGMIFTVSIHVHLLNSLYANPQYIEVSYTMPISKHPLAASRGEYLNCKPYMEYRLFAGPFGVQTIPSEYLIDSSTLYLTMYIDLVTGMGKLTINQIDGLVTKHIYETSAQVGCPVELSANVTNFRGLLSLAGNGTGIVTSAIAGAVPAAIAGTLSAIQPAWDLMTDNTYTSGSNGSFVDYAMPWYLSAEYTTPAEDYNVDRGRPLCKIKTISDLSGYILCAGASMELAATDYELTEILNFMNNGFFYE